MSIIEHSATVINVDGEFITVDILSRSACAACTLKDNCGIFDCKTKEIKIKTDTPDRFTPGQNVMIVIDENHGWTAVFFGYILPLLLVLAALGTTLFVTEDETAAGIYSLMILIPYYLILMLFKKAFARKLIFRIKNR